MKEKELRELMGELSLEEKVMQLVQLPGQAYMTDVTITGAVQENADERMKYLAGATLSVGGAEKVRKIQEQYMARHPHHIPLLFMMDVIHGYRTIFPCPLGQGATFDPELSRAAAAVQAKEARADGIQVTFSPMADLVRDARWGRVMESPGEDPYLNSRMTEAMVKGYQGEDIKVNVASCVKHFAAYGGAQAGRDYTNVELSEHTLRNQYLPAYEAGIKAGARLVMTSFNTWNGLPATANPYLMKDILRGEMGFDGVLISDWGAVGELEVHGVAEDLKEAAMLAMEAGVDMDMCSGSYMHHLLSLVEEGHISIECLDAAVWRILKLKNDLGLFEDPFHGAASSDEEAEGVFLSKESRELARRAVAESVVLLENAGDLLPLSKDQRIGLLGPYAMSQELNSFWAFTGHTEDCVSLYEGANEEGYTVRAAKGALMVPNGTVLGTEVFETKENESDLLSEAMEVADWADTLVLCLGEPKGYSGESTSRTSLCIPKGQMELLSRAKKTGKKVVTLLFSGRPLVVGEIKELSDALLACFLPGTEAGHGIWDVLSGRVAPSGKLSMSFPYTVGQEPLHYNAYSTGRPKPQSGNTMFTSRYLDCPNEALYPFGYGLTYGEVTVSSVQLSSTELTVEGECLATVRVKNTGSHTVTETLQLYIQDEKASRVRPVRELKGFCRVPLSAGEEKEVTFTLREEMLRFAWEDGCRGSEKGYFSVAIGLDSTAPFTARFALV